MVINTNQVALNASTELMSSSAKLSRSLARLASGSKIISPADDSAGLAVAMKTRAQLARLSATASNVTNAVSFCQTQDVYLQQVGVALTRMGQLAVSSLDATKTDADREDNDKEYQILGDFLLEVRHKTFNGVPLFDGTTLNVTTDADGGRFAMPGFQIAPAIDFAGYDSIRSLSQAKGFLGATTDALRQIASARATIGANEEALTFYGNQLTSLQSNLTATSSRITDVDVAQESTNYAKANILAQAGTAMLAQANTLPQSVLKLLS